MWTYYIILKSKNNIYKITFISNYQFNCCAVSVLK